MCVHLYVCVTYPITTTVKLNHVKLTVLDHI